MKYKVGDKVRIKKVRGTFNWAPEMDRYLGKVMTVVDVYSSGECYQMAEDNKRWFWNEFFISGLAELCIPSSRFPAIILDYNLTSAADRNPLVTYLEGC